MLIGLTGGIGSGKSTIARAMAERGYPVYYSDPEAKRIIEHNPLVRNQIEAIFGKEAYRDGKYQSRWVAQQVFGHPERLEQLNRIVHPAVMEDVRRWAQQQAGDCLVESALLYGSGLAQLCDCIVAVTAPEEVRIARTLLRDFSGQETAEHRLHIQKRIQAQQEEEKQALQADIVLCNDGQRSITELTNDLCRALDATKKL